MNVNLPQCYFTIHTLASLNIRPNKYSYTYYLSFLIPFVIGKKLTNNAEKRLYIFVFYKTKKNDLGPYLFISGLYNTLKGKQ